MPLCLRVCNHLHYTLHTTVRYTYIFAQAQRCSNITTHVQHMDNVTALDIKKIKMNVSLSKSKCYSPSPFLSQLRLAEKGADIL